MSKDAFTGDGHADKLRLGGMAVRNGLLIHGPTHWSIAARAPDGTLGVASGRKPTFAPRLTGRIPFLRGPLRLAEAFAVIPLARRALPTARLPLEDPRVLGAAIASSSISGAIRRGGSGPAREAIAAALGLVPAAVALSGSELAAYHGAEHKSIAAYERGEPDSATVPKEHKRCGSNLIGPMIAMSIAGQLVLEKLIPSPGRLARSTAAVASLGAAVELFAWAERNPDSGGARAMHRTGHEIQRVFVTREPAADQLEVAEAALDEILRAEGAER